MNYSKVLCPFLFNGHFTLQTINVYNKADCKPWITCGILTSIRAKRRREKNPRSNTDRYLNIYLRHKNLITKVSRAMLDQYYRTLLEISRKRKRKEKMFIEIKSI